MPQAVTHGRGLHSLTTNQTDITAAIGSFYNRSTRGRHAKFRPFPPNEPRIGVFNAQREIAQELPSPVHYLPKSILTSPSDTPCPRCALQGYSRR